MSLVTREGKGSKLTIAEMDGNLTYLQGLGFEHYIGENYGGGVVFHVWKDSDGTEHGLVVDTTDLNSGDPVEWSNVQDQLAGASSSWNGSGNTLAIVNQDNHESSAAQLCLDSTRNGQTDWYLPSMNELSLLWHNMFNVNKTLSTIGGATELVTNNVFWSSSEGAEYFSFNFDFSIGGSNGDGKDVSYLVRAVRAF
jgi:hypothetical protein